MNKIRLALCDDVSYLADYFKGVFEQREEFDVVGCVYNGDDCISLVESQQPDILLLDIQMESSDTGINLIPVIKKLSPETRIIMFTIHEEDEYIFRSYSEGVSDYIVKTMSVDDIVKSIIDVYNAKNQIIRSEFAKIIVNECERIKVRQNSMMYVITLLTKLSASEFDILKDIYDGNSYSEIAKNRFVEELTIRSHVAHILKKFKKKKMKTLIDELKALNVFEIFNSRE